MTVTPPSTVLTEAQFAASATIYGSDDPAEILGAILDFAGVPYTQAHLGLMRIFSQSPTGDLIVDVVAQANAGQRPAAHKASRLLEEYPAYDVLPALEILTLQNVATDRFINDAERAQLAGRGVAALITLPLVTQQTLIGLIHIEQTAHSPVDPSRLRPLRGLADQAAVVLQNQALLRAARASADALQGQVTALQTLNQLATEMGRFTDEQALLDHVTRIVAEALAVDHAGLVTLDMTNQSGTVTSEWPLTGTIGTQIDFRNNPIFDLMKNNLPKTLLINEAFNDPRVTAQTREIFSRLGIKSIFLLPIIVRGQLIASLGLDLYSEDRVFSENDVTLAQTISAQLSVALENVRFLSDSQRRADQLQRIANFSRSVVATLEMPSLISIMLTETAQFISLDRMYIALFDERAGGLRVVGRYENERPAVKMDAALDPQIGSSFAAEVWKQQQFITYTDTMELRGNRSQYDIGLRSVMGVPVRLRGRVFGAVVVGSFRASRYSETDGALFQQLVNQFAATLENAEAYGQSQRIARSEALINEIVVEIQQAGDLSRMSEIVLRELTTALGATQARLRMNPLKASEDGSVLREVTAARGLPSAAPRDPNETW